MCKKRRRRISAACMKIFFKNIGVDTNYIYHLPQIEDNVSDEQLTVRILAQANKNQQDQQIEGARSGKQEADEAERLFVCQFARLPCVNQRIHHESHVRRLPAQADQVLCSRSHQKRWRLQL